MTRDQAIEAAAVALAKLWRPHYDGRPIMAGDPEGTTARAHVAVLEVLGLLKLDEPPTVERHAAKVLSAVILGPRPASGWQVGPGEEGAERIIGALKSAGFQIVRKE
jgi:hypothetical protein